MTRDPEITSRVPTAVGSDGATARDAGRHGRHDGLLDGITVFVQTRGGAGDRAAGAPYSEAAA